MIKQRLCHDENEVESAPPHCISLILWPDGVSRYTQWIIITLKKFLELCFKD